MSSISDWDIPEDVMAEQNKLVKRNSNGQTEKLKMGDNVLRILPNPNKKAPWQAIHQHFIPQSDGKKKAFSCPRLHNGDFCPACEYHEYLSSTGNYADAEAAKDFKASTRVYVNAIDRDDEISGPKTFALPVQVYEKLLEIYNDDRAGGNFTNPTEVGFDIIISRTGTGLNTRYSVKVDRNNSELGNMDWIDQQVDLKKFIYIPKMDDIKKVMPGNAGRVLKLPSGEDGTVVDVSVTNKRAKGRSAAKDVASEEFIGGIDDSEELEEEAVAS